MRCHPYSVHGLILCGILIVLLVSCAVNIPASRNALEYVDNETNMSLINQFQSHTTHIISNADGILLGRINTLPHYPLGCQIYG